MKYKCLVALPLVFVGCLASVPVMFPVRDISRSRRAEGGYLVRSVVDRAQVIFPASDWKFLESTSPGANYLIEPATGSCLRFHSISFGHQFKEFLLWGYTIRENQWAEELKRVVNDEERQVRFLQEWIKRALSQGEIDQTNNLAIVYPLLERNQSAAILYPLKLDPLQQSVNVNRQLIGSHRFVYAEIRTSSKTGNRQILFNSSIYISYLRYIPRLDSWQFFAAFSHIPIDLRPEQARAVQELFFRTLATLSIDLLRE